MPEFDLLITGAQVVFPDGLRPSPVAIAEGRIVAFRQGEAKKHLDAHGLFLLPGAVDAHVHYNEPGRTDWEGWLTGSRASRAGGATTVFEMPLNASPPTLDASSFQQKLALAKEKSLVDFALWGGLTPTNLAHLPALAEAGVIGYKAFMVDSGTADFRGVSPSTLRQGMVQAASLQLPVAVHAESPDLITQRVVQTGKKGTPTIRDYLDSRPIESEVEAIRIACELAGETGCRLHIVHVSTAEGIEQITLARQRGVDVSAETCPHYLLLTDEDMIRIGPAAKCAPPLRPLAAQRALRAKIDRREIHTVGSDHSPSPASMKQDPDFFKVWGGIAGCQHLVPLLFHLGLDPQTIARLTASAPAERFGLSPQKGRIAIGSDADLILIRTDVKEKIHAKDLLTTHPISPYVGMTITAKVEHTLLRGNSQPTHGLFLPGPRSACSKVPLR